MADREPDALRGGLERVLLIEGQIPAALKVVEAERDFPLQISGLRRRLFQDEHKREDDGRDGRVAG